MPYVASKQYLLSLEQLLKTQKMWLSSPPLTLNTPSEAPFYCDIMPLEHWLQFIFIPKMHDIIDQQSNLPRSMAIAPMAHHVWHSNPNTHDIIELLTRFDALLSDAN